MSAINSQPILMIQNNAQLNAVKLHIQYRYNAAFGLTPVNILIYGINKAGHTLIATCPLSVLTGYTAGEIASQTVVGIPSQDYPYIYYSYTPVVGFKIIGQPTLDVEMRECPDLLPSTTYTAALLS